MRLLEQVGKDAQAEAFAALVGAIATDATLDRKAKLARIDTLLGMLEEGRPMPGDVPVSEQHLEARRQACHLVEQQLRSPVPPADRKLVAAWLKRP